MLFGVSLAALWAHLVLLWGLLGLLWEVLRISFGGLLGLLSHSGSLGRSWGGFWTIFYVAGVDSGLMFNRF